MTELTYESVQVAYDEYMARKAALRERIAAEVARRLEEETRGDLVALSRMLHEAYEGGMSKTDLRAATRSYTNTDRFNVLWNAADGAPAIQGPGRRPGGKR